MNNTLTADLQQKSLKVIMLSQLLVEAMDDIKGTDLYKAKVKIHGRTLNNLLGPIIRQTKSINEADPEMAMNIYNNIDRLMEKIAGLDLTGLLMVNQIHDHYSQHPDDWENFFQLELEKLK